MIKQIQKGFTLIELMIVVAIIGILAAVAIPAYQDYIARAQMSEAITILGGLKSTVEEYYGSQGSVPDLAYLTSRNVRTGGSYVSTISASGNTYTATMKDSGVNGNITGKTVDYSFNTTTGVWDCSPGGTNGVDTAYLPSSCQ